MSSASYVCTVCDAIYDNANSLRRHKTRKNHAEKPAPAPERTFACPVAGCGASYATADALRTHKGRLKHNIAATSTDGNKSARLCGLCDARLDSQVDLCLHLAKSSEDGGHSLQLRIEERSFANYSEFEKWKKQVEKDDQCHFASRTVVKRPKAAVIVKYFYCHRSGSYASKSTGKRAPTKSGTVKAGFTCSAFMVAHRNIVDGRVTLKYCLTHYLHDSLLIRCRLPEDVKEKVAELLAEKLSTKQIMDRVQRDWNSKDDMKRQHLLTATDIFNIERQRGLRQAEKHLFDSVSADLWVKDDGGVNLFNYNPLCTDDKSFQLAIQTSFQREMMIMYGPKAICVDATHDTTQYGLLLVTVLVVDKFGRGIPVAWLITSSESEAALAPFFKELQQRVPEMRETAFFMSDDAPAYWNAWTSVYPSASTVKLLCSWHVLKNWKAHCSKLPALPDEDTLATAHRRIDTFVMLKMLLEEADRKMFYERLNNLLAMLQNQAMDDFVNYLKTTYSRTDKRIEEWARWARTESIVNTNMFLEAFHKMLKHGAFNAKENRRVDALLCCLLNCADSIARDYLKRSATGNVSSKRLLAVHQRHRKCDKDLSLKTEQIEQMAATTWRVPGKDENVSYIVTRKRVLCDCQVRCQYDGCGVCPELYACECHDGSTPGTACKHTHFLHMHLQTQESTPLAESVAIEDDMHLQEHLPQPPRVMEARLLLQRCEDTWHNIKATLQSLSDAEPIKMSLFGLQKIERELGRLGLAPFEVTRPGRGQRNIEMQPRFERRKRRRSPGYRPDEQQLAHEMDCASAYFCGKCNEQDCPLNESSSEETEDEWVQCDKCFSWFHCKCLGLRPEAVSSSTAHFVCPKH